MKINLKLLKNKDKLQDNLYQPYGEITNFKYGNSITANNSYDQNYRITAIHHAGPGGSKIFDLQDIKLP